MSAGIPAVRKGSRPLSAAYLLLAVGAELAGQGEYQVLPQWLWTHTSLLLGTLGLHAGLGQRADPERAPAGFVASAGGSAGRLAGAGHRHAVPLDNLLRAGAFT